MSEPQIEFHCPSGSNYPRPFPAAQDVPEWLKRMPTEVPAGPGGRPWLTVKRCPPFLDALAAGYLIPLAADVHFEMSTGGLSCKSEIPLIHTHPREQLGDAFAGRIVVKFVNPWVIRTPPGYSCLFLQPVNRFDLPFQIFGGVVETDGYYMEVHFPALCLLHAGQNVTLRRGTPVAQVIPFRRESWASSYPDLDAGRMKQSIEEFRDTAGHYKQHYWQKKEYR